jgi:hypothetical protein
MMDRGNPLKVNRRFGRTCSDGLRAGRSRLNSRQGKENFLCSTASRPALGPTQPPIQWVLGAPSHGAKQQRREADHSLPPNAEVTNDGAVPPLLHTS